MTELNWLEKLKQEFFRFFAETYYKGRTWNCAHQDCPMWDSTKKVCCDSTPIHEDCCWLLRWARRQVVGHEQWEAK